MRGLVMEIRSDSVYVMTPEGGFEEWVMDTEEICIGQEVSKPAEVLREHVFVKMRRQMVSIAAVLVVALALGGVGGWAYFTPAGYVNVDINPSVELAFNMFDRVIRVEGVNDDGRELVEFMEVSRFDTVDEALEKVVEASRAEGFISEDKENFILITLTNLKKDLPKVREEVEIVISDLESDQIDIEFLETDKKQFYEAKEAGESPGKRVMVEKAKAILANDPEEGESVDAIDIDTNLGQLIKSVRTGEPIKEKKNNGKKNGKKNADEPSEEPENQNGTSGQSDSEDKSSGKGNGKSDNKGRNDESSDQNKNGNKDDRISPENENGNGNKGTDSGGGNSNSGGNGSKNDLKDKENGAEENGQGTGNGNSNEKNNGNDKDNGSEKDNDSNKEQNKDNSSGSGTQGSKN